MKVYSTEKFNRKLNYLDEKTQHNLLKFVVNIESFTDMQKVEFLPSIYKVSGQDDLYLYKSGDYRLFFTFEKDKSDKIAIILLDIIQLGFNPSKITSRNPKINGSINPNINGSINPNINGSINPKINGSINPNINGSINPNINGSINPKINGSINPKINGSINPNINGSINPKINGSINPNINPSFEGYYLYDLNLETKKFIIPTPGGLLLFYNNELINTEFAVPHQNNGYLVFNKNNEWIAHMESNSKEGFNLFDTFNKWIGFIK